MPNEDLKDEKHEWYRDEQNAFGHLFAIILEIVILYFLNKYYLQFRFFTNCVTAVVWTINFAVAISIIRHILLVVYNPFWFCTLTRIVKDLFALFAFYTIYTIFPFSITSPDLNLLLKILLIVIMIGTGLGIIFHLLKLVSGPWRLK